MKVACLVCTNRKQWKSFWEYQIEKQTYPFKEVFVDSRDGISLGEKRTSLLQRAKRDNIHYAAWFDDDDWSHPERLSRAMGDLSEFGADNLEAIGGIRSYFVNARNHMAIEYQAPEGIIFNGMVFRIDAFPSYFNPNLSTREDTEWLARWQGGFPTYKILGGAPMHIWLCHEKNTTNRIEARSFDCTLPPGLITEEDWKHVPRK